MYFYAESTRPYSVQLKCLLIFSQCSRRWVCETTMIHMVFGVFSRQSGKRGILKTPKTLQKTCCSTKPNLRKVKCWVSLPTPTQTNTGKRSLLSTQYTKQSNLLALLIRSKWKHLSKTSSVLGFLNFLRSKVYPHSHTHPAPSLPLFIPHSKSVKLLKNFYECLELHNGWTKAWYFPCHQIWTVMI